LGDAIATNLFMLGYGWQKGLVPLSAGAIARAIELNGVSIEANKKAFLWGRRAAVDPDKTERAAAPASIVPIKQALSRSVDELIARRAAELTDYQDAAYAARYQSLIDRVRAAEQQRTPGSTALTEAVARYYYKLLAYKDEYEVARLYSKPEFMQKLHAAFDGDIKLRFHLAPPIFNKPDPVSGKAKKSLYGAWMMTGFRWLARLKKLRGTALDIFGRSEERQMERRLIGEYEAIVEELIATLSRDNHTLAVELASVPEQIRGFGHVKLKHVAAAKKTEAALLERWRAPAGTTARAA
jgi:indolepyruvate ferredoxin oxidoreductase